MNHLAQLPWILKIMNRYVQVFNRTLLILDNNVIMY